MTSKANSWGFLNSRTVAGVFLSLLLVFMGISIFFAFRLELGIVPDEVHHYLVSQLYSQTWGIPRDSRYTLGLGPLQHNAFLYYWINGRILNLLGLVAPAMGAATQLVCLRLLNVLYSTVGVVFVYLFARELIPDARGPLVVVLFLTNTLMFVFLSGGVNYDNLLNPCCFASIYYLTRALHGKAFVQNSVTCFAITLFACLVKATMLPLAAIMGALWLGYAVKNRQMLSLHIGWSIKAVGIALVFLALVGLNASVYGINLIKYRSLVPACTQLLSEEDCMHYPIYARDQELGLEHKLTPAEVVAGGYPDPVEYGLDVWTFLILRSTYGILGHRTYYPDLSITLYRMLILWAILLTVRFWQKPFYAVGASYAILALLALVLFQHNYNAELRLGFKHVGIQGRYLFPVIGICYTLMVRAFLQIPRSFLRRLTFVSATTLFLLGGPIVALVTGVGSVFSGWFN